MLRDVHLQPILSTGSEHQGQTSISDPDQNLECTCILSSGVQEKKRLFSSNVFMFCQPNRCHKSLKKMLVFDKFKLGKITMILFHINQM